MDYLTIGSKAILDATVITPVGDLDMTSADEVEEAIVKADGDTVIVDLRHVEFIDSVGIMALLRATRTRSWPGSEVQVIPGPECVDTLFDMTLTRSQIRFVDHTVVDLVNGQIWLG